MEATDATGHPTNRTVGQARPLEICRYWELPWRNAYSTEPQGLLQLMAVAVALVDVEMVEAAMDWVAVV